MRLIIKYQNWLLAILTGVAIGFSFPPYQQSWLIFFAFVPLFFLLEKTDDPKSRFKYFLIAGSVAKFISFIWVTYVATVYGQMPHVITWPLYIIYSVLTGLHLPFIILIPYHLVEKYVQKDDNKALGSNVKNKIFSISLRNWLIIASGIALMEFISPTLFKWTFGNLAYSNIFFIQIADIVGSDGLSSLLFLFNLFVYFLFKTFQKYRAFNFKTLDIPQKDRILLKSDRQKLLWLAVIVLFVYSYGVVRYYQVNKAYENSSESINVGLLQPNFSLEHLASNRNLTEQEKFNSFIKLLRQGENLIKSTDKPLDLLVWPESTFSFVYDRNSSQDILVKNRINEYVNQHKIDLIFTTFTLEKIEKAKPINNNNENTTSEEAQILEEEYDTNVYSSSFILRNKDNQVDRYHKIYLIPFGEYIPFADLIPAFAEFLDKYISHLSMFTAGKEFKTLKTSKGKLVGSTICYDILDSNISRRMSLNGATIIINQSNFAWFGRGGAPGSVLQLLRFRGIESRLPTLMAANSGESVIMSATGEYLTPITKLFVEDAQTLTVNSAKVYSFYRQFGNLFVYVVSAIFVGFVLVGWKKRTK